MVWKKGLAEEPKIPDVRELDICLLEESGTRKIQIYGTFNLFKEVIKQDGEKMKKDSPYTLKRIISGAVIVSAKGRQDQLQHHSAVCSLLWRETLSSHGAAISINSRV